MGISRGPLHWDNKGVMLSVNRMIQDTLILLSLMSLKLKAVLGVTLSQGWFNNENELMFYLLLVSAFQPVDLLLQLLALPL